MYSETEHRLPQRGIPENRQIPANIRLAALGELLQQKNGGLYLRFCLPRDKLVEHIPKSVASSTSNGFHHGL